MSQKHFIELWFNLTLAIKYTYLGKYVQNRISINLLNFKNNKYGF